MYLVQDKIPGIVVTALHFKLLNLEETMETFNGFRHFADLPKDMVILSDSGGFQVLSLIHRKGLGKIDETGATFRPPENPSQKVLFTPEMSQEVQHTIGSDIRVALDIPMNGNESWKETGKSLEMTTRWAIRAKNRFLELNNITPAEYEAGRTIVQKQDGKEWIDINRPLLFAVVQGGNYPDLREESARQLVSVGFDGYGFGGWPLDEEGKLHTKILGAVRRAVPEEYLVYGMGIGTPDDITTCHQMGYRLFDCVIPTRNARHGYLFVTPGHGEKRGKTFDILRIKKSIYALDKGPVDPFCGCPVCMRYSRAYLRFLFKNKNPIIFTLATLHNVWWYQDFMEKLSP